MIVIFATVFYILPLAFCYPPCFDITHSECSGYDGPVDEVTVSDSEECHIICEDEYGSRCKFLIFDLDDSINCKIFEDPIYEFVKHCNIIGGPKEVSGECSLDYPSDSTCDVFRRGNCVYPEGRTKIIQTKDWENCQNVCMLIECQYWTFKIDDGTCSLITSSKDMQCAWQFSPRTPSLEDCDDYVPTSSNPDDTTTKHPDHTTTSTTTFTATTSTTTATTTSTTTTSTTSTNTTPDINTCYLPNLGSPDANRFFKGKKGEPQTIFCNHIFTESEPCYMKNPGYNNGEWLTVDPNSHLDFVYDCDGFTPLSELRPLLDGSCGFNISHIEDRHVGVWTCGTMGEEQTAIKVVSNATLCVQTSSCSGNFIEINEICGCFAFNLTESLSWQNAQKFCQKEGGDLVTLDSYEKNDIIFNHWGQYDNWVNPWIGGHKDGGHWKWVSNGETFPDEESEDPWANWGWGQPDAGDCVYMDKIGKGTWASDNCIIEGTFICEIN